MSVFCATFRENFRSVFRHSVLLIFLVTKIRFLLPTQFLTKYYSTETVSFIPINFSTTPAVVIDIFTVTLFTKKSHFFLMNKKLLTVLSYLSNLHFLQQFLINVILSFTFFQQIIVAFKNNSSN